PLDAPYSFWIRSPCKADIPIAWRPDGHPRLDSLSRCRGPDVRPGLVGGTGAEDDRGLLRRRPAHALARSRPVDVRCHLQPALVRGPAARGRLRQLSPLPGYPFYPLCRRTVGWLALRANVSSPEAHQRL